MIRLVFVTCVALGAALAKHPPPLQEGEHPSPVPFEDVGSVLLQDEPIAIPSSGTQQVYTLSPGNYYTTSRNYPNLYRNNDDYSFTVRGQEGQTVTMNCHPFILDYTPRCNEDYLSINGQRYCGMYGPPPISSSELKVHFHSDSSDSAPGYRCNITVPVPGATTAAPPSGGCRCGRRQNSRIVGGTDATAGQFPWQAGLVHRGMAFPFCGGSVINSRYVLTAAQCTYRKAAYQVSVLLGVLHLTQHDAGERRVRVEKIIQHPYYSGLTVSGFDFSLLKLASPVTFSATISPVCLPEAAEAYSGVTGVVSSYGSDGVSLPQTTTLQYLDVNVWSQSSCVQVWHYMLKPNMVCVSSLSRDEEPTPIADNGDPLVTEVSGSFRLVGVASFGPDDYVPDAPDVYGRVSSVLYWIAENTADAETCYP